MKINIKQHRLTKEKLGEIINILSEISDNSIAYNWQIEFVIEDNSYTKDELEKEISAAQIRLNDLLDNDYIVTHTKTRYKSNPRVNFKIKDNYNNSI